MHNISFYSKFISCFYMFRAHVLIIRRSKLHYTASGIITLCTWPSVALQPVHGTATYRCDDTRGCIMQFWPPDDEHMCSKHVEAWNKTYCKTKFCASRWLITKINIVRCTVRETSKFGIAMFWPGRELDRWALFVLVPRLGLRGAKPPFPHVSLWHSA